MGIPGKKNNEKSFIQLFFLDIENILNIQFYTPNLESVDL